MFYSVLFCFIFRTIYSLFFFTFSSKFILFPIFSLFVFHIFFSTFFIPFFSHLLSILLLHLSIFLLFFLFFFLSFAGLEKNEKISHLNSQTLLIRIIKSSFQTRQILFNSFYSYMEIETSKNSTIIIDLWILFTLSGNSRNRSKVHTLCARKYSNGSMTRDSLQSAISGFGTALESVFSSMLVLGETEIDKMKKVWLHCNKTFWTKLN